MLLAAVFAAHAEHADCIRCSRAVTSPPPLHSDTQRDIRTKKQALETSSVALHLRHIITVHSRRALSGPADQLRGTRVKLINRGTLANPYGVASPDNGTYTLTYDEEGGGRVSGLFRDRTGGQKPPFDGDMCHGEHDDLCLGDGCVRRVGGGEGWWWRGLVVGSRMTTLRGAWGGFVRDDDGQGFGALRHVQA